jgi:hypothetical protein
MELMLADPLSNDTFDFCRDKQCARQEEMQHLNLFNLRETF